MNNKLMWKDRIFFALFFLFIFIIPLSQYVSVRILVVVLIYSFFLGDKKGTFTTFLKNSWDVLLYLLVLIIGLSYSDDFKLGFRVIEMSFSLLAIPLVFNNLPSLSKERQHQIFLAFIIGLIFSSSICWIYAFFRLHETGDKSVLFFEHFTQIISSQPTYMAYYLCFSITVGLYFLYYEKIKIAISQQILALVFLFATLMLTGGRTAYISMLLVFTFFILKFLFEDNRLIERKFVFGFVSLFLTGMLFINHYNFNTIVVDGNVSGDYWERLSLWKSAIDANPSIVFGVGTGDFKKVMNDYYNSHGLSQFSNESFNAHNQFLQSFFSNGLIGVITVLLLVARPLYLSVRYQNVLGILVFFSFLMYGMTEVFLGRYQGVVFFALLHQAFIVFYFGRRPSFSLK